MYDLIVLAPPDAGVSSGGAKSAGMFLRKRKKLLVGHNATRNRPSKERERERRRQWQWKRSRRTHERGTRSARKMSGRVIILRTSLVFLHLIALHSSAC